MIDLHAHSCCSDGTLTPEELVDLAMEKGLTAMALTDHDTMDGVKRIQEAFADHPEICDLEVRGAVYDIMTGAVEWL